MNTTITPVDVPEQLERELQSLRFKQLGIKRLPVELARHAVIDADALGDAVAAEAARAVLGERLRAHREYDALTKQIAQLEARLADAQQRVRAELATRADARLSKIQAEYKAAQLTCGRIFRSLLQQNARSSNTPGAGTVKIDYRLHLPGITPFSNQGTTGEMMNMGHLPFENDHE